MSQLLDVLRLARAPNVFTALADILLGFLITHDDGGSPAVLGLLLASSALLYTAGMVLNDVFDIEQDRRERPERPLPAGRISFTKARAWGFALLAGGVLCGAAAGFLANTIRGVAVAVALAAMIVAYNAGLKRTPLGPLAMGVCRFGNILLGASAAAFPWRPMHGVIAAGLGVYVAGVTWFARTEATASRRTSLILAVVVMLAGVALLWWSPWAPESTALEIGRPELAWRDSNRWAIMWSGLGALIAWRCARAIVEPTPGRVQMAVKLSILSIIILDAAVCLGVHGPFGGFSIVVLLAPALLLGRWVYST